MQWNERTGRRLKLRDLHVLLTVVQRRSMARAANELAMSQPAVSKAIADLERELGVRLLDRSPRGVEPTDYGQALVRRGLTIFDELRQGVQELKFLADPSVGELRIGSSEAMAAGVLPAVIREMSRRHPRIVITINQALFATTRYHALHDRSVDVLFGRLFSPPPAEERVVAEPLFDDRVVAVVGKHHRLATSRRLTLASLAEQHWILPPKGSEAGRLAAEIFSTSGLPVPRAPVTTISIHVALRLLSSEPFVTFLPHSVLRFGGHQQSLKILPLELPKQQRPVAAIMLKDRTVSPLVQVFVDCVRRIAAPGPS